MNSDKFPQRYAPQNQMRNSNPEPEALRNLIVNYIPSAVSEENLRDLFGAYGQIEYAKVVTDRESRQSRGFGFVKYVHASSAVNAIHFLNGYPVMNKRLKVAYAKPEFARNANAPYYPMMPVPGYSPMMMMPQGGPQAYPQPGMMMGQPQMAIPSQPKPQQGAPQ